MLLLLQALTLTFVYFQEAVVSSEDTGRDYDHCVRLQKKVKAFDQDLAVEAARVDTINKLAEKLVSQGHAGSADITHRQQALNERWNRLQDRASERRQRLAEACEMHAFDRDCKDVSDLISEKVLTGKLGWCSRESTRFPPMCPACKSSTPCHVRAQWDYITGSLLLFCQN